MYDPHRRGKGLLKIASSHWQLLGYNLSPPLSSDSKRSSGPEWVVTYFASTLFTPAGLDIYSRQGVRLEDALVISIIEGLEGLGGEVAGLVKDGGMFRVPVDDDSS